MKNRQSNNISEKGCKHDSEEGSNDSSRYSSFEDDADQGITIEEDLRRNLELMNKQMANNIDQSKYKTLIYDCNAKIEQYLILTLEMVLTQLRSMLHLLCTHLGNRLIQISLRRVFLVRDKALVMYLLINRFFHISKTSKVSPLHII